MIERPAEPAEVLQQVIEVGEVEEVGIALIRDVPQAFQEQGDKARRALVPKTVLVVGVAAANEDLRHLLQLDIVSDFEQRIETRCLIEALRIDDEDVEAGLLQGGGRRGKDLALGIVDDQRDVLLRPVEDVRHDVARGLTGADARDQAQVLIALGLRKPQCLSVEEKAGVGRVEPGAIVPRLGELCAGVLLQEPSLDEHGCACP